MISLVKMAGAIVCMICDQVITPNQDVIECSGCLTWIHRRCTKLSNVEFDEIFALWKKNYSHQWKCINCKPSEVKRLSAAPSSVYNAGERSSSLAIHEEYEDNVTDDNQQINLPSSTANNKLKMGMDDIQKKGEDNKDLNGMSQIIALLLEQNKNIQDIIMEIKTIKNDKIEKLEKEVEEIKQKLMNTKQVTDIVDTPKSSSQLPIDTISELQERTAKNIIILNIEESKSADSNDKKHVTAVQYKLGGGGGGQKRNDYPKALKLSNELAALVGQDTMASRHEVVNKVRSIIKEKNLYDPGNKYYAICDDDAMLKVIGVKRFRIVGMIKYLKNHFIS